MRSSSGSADAFHVSSNGKEEIIHDETNQYLHIIITSDHDTSSKTNITELIDLNQVMTTVATNFKCAHINFMGKENEKLRNQLVILTSSCVNPSSQENSALMINSKPGNLQKRLAQVVNWFNGNGFKDGDESINTSSLAINDDPFEFNHQNSIRNKDHKRIIMLTIAMTPTMDQFRDHVNNALL